jgi:hypothetical protein
MALSKRTIQGFREIKNLFLATTSVPPTRLAWNDVENAEIWLRVFCQVVEVGRANPSKKLLESTRLQSLIAFEALSPLSSSDRKPRIHTVLREIGTRYCSASVGQCRKTKALVSNFDVLQRYPGGPKGLLRDLVEIKGPDAGRQRIERVTANLAYIKCKGARDLLTTGLRISDDYLAFDVRWKNVLQKVGVQVPKGTFANSRKYGDFEAMLMEEVAKPLCLTGKQLDQLVFRNYDAIMKADV